MPKNSGQTFLMSFFAPVRMSLQYLLMIRREIFPTATVTSVRRREPGQTASISLWICSAFFPNRTDTSPRRTL